MAEKLSKGSNMKNINFLVRQMLLSDMQELMRLKNEECWNQTEQDWELLISFKDSVNFVAEMDNKIIGTVTAINYANKTSWIGMMLVDKNYRRLGISKALLNVAIENLKDCESIKLDATPVGHHVYEKIGFIDEYDINRITNTAVLEIILDNDIKTHKVSINDMNEIAELDEDIFGANRKEMLIYLFNNSPELAWAVKNNSKIVGFSLGRKGTKFTQIGPVFASSDEEIKSLITSAANQIIGKPAVVDLLTDKDSVEIWLSENGFIKQRAFKRMYLNINPHSGKVEKQYLISGPELG